LFARESQSDVNLEFPIWSSRNCLPCDIEAFYTWRLSTTTEITY
jgi:hypothetical protein